MSFLAEIGFQPDAIISSPKIRARQTAELVGAALGVGVRLDDRLAGGFDPAAVDAILADAGDPCRPVLVGHDPDFSELLGWLANADGLTMKKGAFARVDVQGAVADGPGNLALAGPAGPAGSRPALARRVRTRWRRWPCGLAPREGGRPG